MGTLPLPRNPVSTVTGVRLSMLPVAGSISTSPVASEISSAFLLFELASSAMMARGNAVLFTKWSAGK